MARPLARSAAALAAAGAVALATAGAVALAACSPTGNARDSEGSPAQSSITVRVWDEAAAGAYTKSFEAFSAAHPDIAVEVEVVPWGEYWTRVDQDLRAGEMADVFWTNASGVAGLAEAGSLLDLTAALDAEREGWNDAVTELFTREGTLWGAPQLIDSTALFYNADLLTDAGLDAGTLAWSPRAEADTLTPALRTLTTDTGDNHPGDTDFDPDSVAVWGFNAENDLQAIWLGFLAQNGATFQGGDQYTFNSPAGVAASQYLVDLINTEHVAPPAEDTTTDPETTRRLFVQGKLALFQSGQYSLPAAADIDSFAWGIAPVVQGPQGRISVVHGVAAVGNAASAHPEATTEVLKWLASAGGQRPLGQTGAGLPAALDAQEAFTDYWAAHGIDAAEFVNAAAGHTTASPVGPRSNAGLDAIGTVFPDMFEGRVPVADALEQAEQLANEAIAD